MDFIQLIKRSFLKKGCAEGEIVFAIWRRNAGCQSYFILQDLKAIPDDFLPGEPHE